MDEKKRTLFIKAYREATRLYREGKVEEAYACMGEGMERVISYEHTLLG